jgi:hypothetical protein
MERTVTANSNTAGLPLGMHRSALPQCRCAESAGEGLTQRHAMQCAPNSVRTLLMSERHSAALSRCRSANAPLACEAVVALAAAAATRRKPFGVGVGVGGTASASDERNIVGCNVHSRTTYRRTRAPPCTACTHDAHTEALALLGNNGGAALRCVALRCISFRCISLRTRPNRNECA